MKLNLCEKEEKVMPKISNKLYDVLKFIAQIVLPALGTFYFAIASIWGLPYAEQIVGLCHDGVHQAGKVEAAGGTFRQSH